MYEDCIWLHERTEPDIWKHLNEPFLIESTSQLEPEEFFKLPTVQQLGVSNSNAVLTDSLNQKLTHRKILSTFYTVCRDSNDPVDGARGKWVAIHQLPRYAFPKTIVTFFKNHGYITKS